MTPIRVLSVASEIYPIIKTGGLADVVGALPGALKAEGIEVHSRYKLLFWKILKYHRSIPFAHSAADNRSGLIKNFHALTR